MLYLVLDSWCADGYLPKRRPPLLAAFDLGQPEALEAQQAGGAIHSPPNDDDHSEYWAYRHETYFCSR